MSHVIIFLNSNLRFLIITLTVAMLEFQWNRIAMLRYVKKKDFFHPIYKSESKFLSERINAAKAKVSPQDMPAKMV